MSTESLQDRIDEATFDFTIGDAESAISKLRAVLEEAPESFEAWLALAEVLFAESDLTGALEAGEKAHQLRPEDIHINTSLSRIWVAKGDKDKAEHYNAQARMLGWKDELRQPPPAGD